MNQKTFGEEGEHAYHLRDLFAKHCPKIQKQKRMQAYYLESFLNEAIELDLEEREEFEQSEEQTVSSAPRRKPAQSMGGKGAR